MELLGVGDRVDRLNLVVRDVQRDHGDRLLEQQMDLGRGHEVRASTWW
jgi:hypothetical protein